MLWGPDRSVLCSFHGTEGGNHPWSIKKAHHFLLTFAAGWLQPYCKQSCRRKEEKGREKENFADQGLAPADDANLTWRAAACLPGGLVARRGRLRKGGLVGRDSAFVSKGAHAGQRSRLMHRNKLLIQERIMA